MASPRGSSRRAGRWCKSPRSSYWSAPVFQSTPPLPLCSGPSTPSRYCKGSAQTKPLWARKGCPLLGAGLRCAAQNRGSIVMQGRPPERALYAGLQRARVGEGQVACADALILDLEDAVAPDEKLRARDQVCAAVKGGGYGGREVVIRVNALETPWGTADILAACDAEPDAIPRAEGRPCRRHRQRRQDSAR